MKNSLLLCLTLPLTLLASPQGMEIVSGDASLTQVNSNHLQIHSSNKAILHWNKFGVEKGKHVQFVQPSSKSAVLNRVKGKEASSILGKLSANGKVYLLNPHGVIIGKDAIIQTADFLASTLDVSNDQFLNGAELLFKGDSTAAIINYGTIEAIDGGVTLLGRIVNNEGALIAKKGAVNIAAAGEILLQLQDIPILTIQPSLEPDSHIDHKGRIEAIVAQLQTEGKVYHYGINLEGSVIALNTVEEKGRIYLKADSLNIAPNTIVRGSTIDIQTSGFLYQEGVVRADALKIATENGLLMNTGVLRSYDIRIDVEKLLNSGTVSAPTIAIHTQNTYTGTAEEKIFSRQLFLSSDTSIFSSGTFQCPAGRITVLAPTINLVSARLDTSSEKGGGKIFIGGGKHGETLQSPNANFTRLSGNTTLLANSKNGAHAGSIVVWSEENTVTYGTIQATAAGQGNGGFIEVSGKGNLHCSSEMSVSTESGKPGNIRLDPKNVVIDSVTGIYPQYQLIDPRQGSGTTGAGAFGNNLFSLTSGNFVVPKSGDDLNGTASGAVYLYNATTGALISTLVGGQANCSVGSGGIVGLTNGNYVILSPVWDNGGATNAGAVTWANGTTGVTGVVSATNSIVGSTTNDGVASGGSAGVIALTNGNYVVSSPNWNNGAATTAGAATWATGTATTGLTISVSNSLVGTSTADRVGVQVVPLTNGNYVVVSGAWNGTVGAVTWGNGATGIVGAVAGSNSLTGTAAGSSVGSGGVVALTNGNYVVNSFFWDNGAATDAGAVTWGNGATGTIGVVSTGNSLYGTTTQDYVGGANGALSGGQGGVFALTNGNYVVASPLWDGPGPVANVGAVTWCDGTGPTAAAVSTLNSLHGSTADDQVGNVGGSLGNSAGVTPLSNGHYVVGSPFWDNGGTADVGAATWCDGTMTTGAAVAPGNSLIGTTANDQVALGGICALTNGNYVVRAPAWNNGAATTAGAATWRDGSMSTSGTVSAANSLVGGTTADQVSGGNARFNILALTNGNYVVFSPVWDGAVSNAGAVTWGNGLGGTVGLVSASNSLVGSTANDQIGSSGGTVLTNGNYVVKSPNWDNGAVVNAGAATWGNGTGGTVGPVTTLNSLVGTTANDQIGLNAVALTNGNYVANSQLWDNGAIVNAGAVTLCNGSTPSPTGPVTVVNSVTGQQSGAGGVGQVGNITAGVFAAAFTGEGTSGRVRVGLFDINEMTYDRAQTQTITIAPSALTTTLNTGSPVTIEASNDVTISSDISASPGAGTLTVSAGRSVAINANITTGNADLLVTANAPLSSGVIDSDRDAGNATLSIGNGFTIDTGTGDLTLSLEDGAGLTNSGSADLSVGDNASLLCSGSGALTLTAEEHNITLGNNSLLQTANGNIFLTAGVSIIAGANTTTIQTTGSGELILLTDNLFPTAPAFGTGHVDFPNATLMTGGGRLLIYTADRALNTQPATINGVAYVPGPIFVDSPTEKWGTYYPNSSGIPFTIFYKTGETPTPPAPPPPSPSPSPGPAPSPSSAVARAVASNNNSVITGFQNVFFQWTNPWQNDLYFSADLYPPYLTPKNLRLRLPSLIPNALDPSEGMR